VVYVELAAAAADDDDNIMFYSDIHGRDETFKYIFILCAIRLCFSTFRHKCYEV
jgi:hypothetical protein